MNWGVNPFHFTESNIPSRDKVFKRKDDTSQPSRTHKLEVHADGGTKTVKDENSAYRTVLKNGAWLFSVDLVSLALSIANNAYTILFKNREVLSHMKHLWKKKLEPAPRGLQRIAASVVWFEIVVLLVIFACLLNSVAQFFYRSRSSYRKWSHLNDIAWVWTRMLSKFSAIMLVGRAHPSLIFEDVNQALVSKTCDGVSAPCLPACCIVAYYVITRLVFIIGGLGSFAVKACLAADMINRTMAACRRTTNYGSIFSCIMFLYAFMNQALSMVDVPHRLRMRAMSWIFAGRDGVFDGEELIYLDVYLARLSQAIWEAHEGKEFTAFAALASFTHQDVQRLARVETRKHKFALRLGFDTSLEVRLNRG